MVRRKNVSWGDTSLSLAAQATTRHYVADVWRAFCRHLVGFLVSVEWTRTRGAACRDSRRRLGSIVFCSHSATLVLERMIRLAANDGVFVFRFFGVYTPCPKNRPGLLLVVYILAKY